MIGAVWLVACRQPDPGRPIVLAGPTVASGSPLAPYAAELAVAFDRDVALIGEATDGVHHLPIEVRGSSSFVVPLIGLYADNAWSVSLVATDDDGGTVSLDPISFRTPPLPELFPTLTLRVDDPGVSGLTLLPITAHDLPYAWLVVLDDDAEVVWMFDGEGEKFLEARVVDGGVRTLHRNQLVEVDWLGRDRRRLSSGLAEGQGGLLVEGTTSFTHELSETPRGTWLTITKEAKTLPAVPVSYTSAETSEQLIADDVVVEIDPEVGEVVARWSVAEHLDQSRIGYGSLIPAAVGIDWAHTNAVSEHDGRWLTSVRHQDAVVDVDTATGELRWILGNPAGWSEPFRELLLEPVGEPFAWSWHQHSPKWLGDGRVLLFDNGNFGAAPFTDDPKVSMANVRTRAVLYEVDEGARTVRQLWDLSVDPPVNSSAMGDVDLLPDGHVLVTHAFVQWEGGVRNVDLGRHWPSVRVVEFDPDTGEVVWDLDVWGALGPETTSTTLPPSHAGWQSFRAERFDSFTPVP